MDQLRFAISTIAGWFSFIPSWVFALLLLGVATIAALIVHAVLVRLVRHAIRGRSDYLGPLLARTRNLSRFALLVLAWGPALQSGLFSASAADFLGRILVVAFVVLAGWAAFTVVTLASEIYLRRFSLETVDNVLARKHYTQVHILRRAVAFFILLITIGGALMTFPSIRQYGISLFASAGVAGIVIGVAAQPVLSNLIAGIQLAITQPIRLEDSIVVEGEWGWVEEITATYVVVRLWDLRRLVLPLTYFIQKPFQNWTRRGSSIIGSVFLNLDYTAPVAALRREAEAIAAASPLWDKKVVNLQVSDATERTLQIRVLASAADAGAAWDLRCEIREKLIVFMQERYPDALPRQRAEVIGGSVPQVAPPSVHE
jgi:small-conductance mechanosensitive channel